MKRILYIESNTDGTVGGSYFSLLYLVQGLDKSRFDPWVVFFQDNVLVPEFRKVTPHVYVLSNRLRAGRRRTRVARHLQLLWHDLVVKYLQMRELIRDLRPDLVHLNNAYSNIDGWTLACRMGGVKIISHDRGTDFPCSLRTRFFARFLNAIISVSDSFRDRVVSQRIGARRARRVYNGLDLDTVLAASPLAAVARVREELRLNGAGPVIGIVGNIDRWKGQMIVLQAVRRVKEAFPAVRCLVVGAVCKGAEEYREQLAAYTRDNGLIGQIVFTGYRRDVPALLGAMDILVHASVTPEPFGRVLLEGMALAKPIVGTDGGGVPEIVNHRETGLLVPMGDSEALAEALLFYLANPELARRIGEQGRQRLCERFSVERMVRETEAIYRDVLLA